MRHALIAAFALFAACAQNPQAMDPTNAMPNLGVTPDDSRDMTAFLYTLE